MIDRADGASGVWRRNAWLAVLGLAFLLALLALDYDGFAALVRKHYWAFHDSFRQKDSTQVVWAYRLSRLAAVGALAVYAAAGLAKLDIIGWLDGPREDPGARWRGLLVGSAAMLGLVFLGNRIVRDLALARSLDLAVAHAEYSGRYYEDNVNEHGFFGVRRFAEQHRGGALVILRPIRMYEVPTSPWQGHLRIDHLHVSRNLFPDMRVYLRYADACDPTSLDIQWLAARGITWMIRDCDAEFSFQPEPIVLGSAQGAR